LTRPPPQLRRNAGIIEKEDVVGCAIIDIQYSLSTTRRNAERAGLLSLKGGSQESVGGSGFAVTIIGDLKRINLGVFPGSISVAGIVW